ncbi:MAG: hypothetical protein D6730_19185 [Bacteroidetes bacterium]|nr:MAG: hypothetical protein D6730_19185 [Bacteroidota bacterium]
MHNSKLIQIMRTLSAAELARFDKYVHSPFFTVHDDTIRLFEEVYATYPAFEPEALDAERVYARIYPGAAYNDGRMRTLRKYLLKLLLGFLGQVELEKNSLELDRYQVQALYKRGLDKYFLKQMEDAERKLEEFPHLNADYFKYRFQLAQLRIEHQVTRESRWAPRERTEALQALDHYYLAEKLNYASALIMNRAVFEDGNTLPPLLKEVLQYCEQELPELPLVVQAYFHLIQVMVSPQHVQHYRALRKLLGLPHHGFEPHDLLNIYSFLINYCNQQYRKGAEQFLTEMFELYREILPVGLLFDNNMTASHHYKNITTLGLRLGEYEWTEEFIETYKNHIATEYRQGVYNYNKAHLLAYRRDFSGALKHLRQVNFIDPFYRISYNLLLLKIYYECEEVEPFYALCTSFQTFMRRKKKLSASEREIYLNFIKFAKALFQIKTGEHHQAARVRKRLEACHKLIEQKWLMEKLEELEGKRGNASLPEGPA